MSWRGWLLMAGFVLVALLLVAHVVGYYVQMAAIVLALVVVLALLVRSGWRKAAYALGRGRRDHSPHRRR